MVVRLRRKTKLGMTLVEMLAAMAVTLILILALAQVFSIIGDNVADGRAIVEMSSAIRDTANRLQEDLDGITVPARPWPEPGSGLGYLECLEGTGYDRVPNFSNSLLTESIVGDIDDVLAFTVRTTGQPFVGRLNGNPIRSNVAEIIWWLELNDANKKLKDPDWDPRNKNGWDWDPELGDKETFNLHRRVLLVLPNLKLASMNQQVFYYKNDLSVRRENGNLLANSLADLTRRQNRVGHGGSFPSPLRAALMPKRDKIDLKRAVRGGEDIILSNVIGFDIRVFDPTVPIMLDPTDSEAVVPGDPGYASRTHQSYGAFVDLGFNRYLTFRVSSTFSGDPYKKSGLSGLPVFPGDSRKKQYVYDTWSLDYEFDGINQDINQDGRSFIPWQEKLDQGTNGLDDDGINGVDDLNERETSPPYPSPLRGIQIVIRTLDPDSRQVRQITVTSDFTPE
ncbi:MAG TPA: type II secretion system protein [Planctomycetaceae bacterium]|nr:type II secretion system protein [Planctomycetaceae bacterium]